MTSGQTTTINAKTGSAVGWADVWAAAAAEITTRDWVLRSYRADLQAIEDALLDDERVLGIRPLYDNRHDEPWKETGAIVVTPRRLLVVPTGPVETTRRWLKVSVVHSEPPTAETVLFSDIESVSLRRTIFSGMQLRIETRDGRLYVSGTGAKRAGPDRFLATLQEQIAKPDVQHV